jgi:hypothetical protein
MDPYQNYLNNFKKFSPYVVGSLIRFRGLSDYSTYINNKANEIISKASTEMGIDNVRLQQEILQLGVAYVKIFATMNKGEKSRHH